MRAGSKSSLEFHVVKHELYWVISGQLELGLRDGNKRGKDTSIVIGPGECYEIPPGTMHQRRAITDVVILEACSCDSDADSHIIIDGRN
jgi:mannose-6-phosphate isomerase-like protein (cupin superfamily)